MRRRSSRLPMTRRLAADDDDNTSGKRKTRGTVSAVWIPSNLSRSLFEWEIDDFIQGKRRRALIFRYYYRGWIWALVAMDSFDIKFPVESIAPRRITE